MAVVSRTCTTGLVAALVFSLPAAAEEEILDLPTTGLDGWSSTKVPLPASCQPNEVLDPSSIPLGSPVTVFEATPSRPFTGRARRLADTELPSIAGFETRGLRVTCSADSAETPVPEPTLVIELRQNGEPTSRFGHVRAFVPSPTGEAFVLDNFVTVADGWQHRTRIIRPRERWIRLLPATRCSEVHSWVGEHLLMYGATNADTHEVCLFDDLGVLAHRWSLPRGSSEGDASGATAHTFVSFEQGVVHIDPAGCRVDVIETRTGRTASRQLGPDCDLNLIHSASAKGGSFEQLRARLFDL